MKRISLFTLAALLCPLAHADADVDNLVTMAARGGNAVESILYNKPVVAVLCVPRQSAMDLSDELVRLGIQGFWNFSHYDLSVVYPQVTVENVHLGDSLMSLGYRLRNQE